MKANSVPTVIALDVEPAAVAEHDRGRCGLAGRRTGSTRRSLDGRLVGVAVGVVDLAEVSTLPPRARRPASRARPPGPLQRRRDVGRAARACAGRRGPSSCGRAPSRPPSAGTPRSSPAPGASRDRPGSPAVPTGQPVLHARGEPVGDELLQRVDVVRQARDQHAGAVALEVAELERLDVGEQVARAGRSALAGRPRPTW